MSNVIETAFAKFAVAFVAVAMLVALVAPAAQAQTTEELQAMINDLLAQVASLQGQLGGGSDMSAAGVCPYTWTRSLNMGDTGADVMKLQQFLNADAETRVAAAGAGSAGMETEYYGPATGAAVAKFQTKYRSEILTPLGLVNATTFFGPATMGQANALCVTAVDAGDDMDDADDSDDMDEEEEEVDESEDELSDTEADIDNNYNLKDGEDTELEEGQENAPIADIEFDVEDGDVEIQRVDVTADFNGGTGDEQDPWDVFETLSLWVDGDMVAELDVDDEDEWEEDTPNTGDWRARFTGLDIVVREGEEANITVGATVHGAIDLGTDDTTDWLIMVPAQGIRGRDGSGVDQYTGDTSDSVTVTIQAEGADDEVAFKASTNDPDSTTLQLEDDARSDWMTVFIFDIDTDDSTNDIEVDGLLVNVDATEDGTTATNTNLLVNDARLVVGGTVYDDVTITHGTSGTFDFDFDRGEFMINAGDRQEVEFQLEFLQLPSTLEGATVQANVNSSDTQNEFDGAADITDTGASTGEEHTLRTAGVILDLVSTDETFVENDDTSTTDNEGTFELVFDVTAFEQDVYVEQTTDRSTTTTNQGVNYFVSTGGSEITTGTTSANLDSAADVDGTNTYFIVNEGTTERFTLTVDVDPVSAGFYKVQLHSMNFASSAAVPDTTQLAIPASDFDSDALSI